MATTVETVITFGRSRSNAPSLTASSSAAPPGVTPTRKTPTGPLSCLPSRPWCCRATPALCMPFLAKPLSSTTPTTPTGRSAAVGVGVVSEPTLRWTSTRTRRHTQQLASYRTLSGIDQTLLPLTDFVGGGAYFEDQRFVFDAQTQ